MADTKAKTTEPAELGPFRSYLRDSKSLLNSLVVILPLFAVYQIGILTTDGVRNGVDFITDTLRFTIFGGNTVAYVSFNLLVLLGFGAAIFFLRKKQSFSPKTYGFLVLESVGYSLVLGGLVGGVLVNLGIEPSLQVIAATTTESLGPLDNFILSLGAGLYEELVFRLFLFGGGVFVLTKWLKVDKLPAVIGAIIVTSLMFSAIHYIGNLADAFTFYSFAFRFLAGVFFAVLYYTRGLAVAVYTHALYDVWVLVF